MEIGFFTCHDMTISGVHILDKFVESADDWQYLLIPSLFTRRYNETSNHG